MRTDTCSILLIPVIVVLTNIKFQHIKFKVVFTLHNSKQDAYNLTNKDFFFCYDKKLSIFLHKKGFRYITVARNDNDMRFWMYQKSYILNKTIHEYWNMIP